MVERNPKYVLMWNSKSAESIKRHFEEYPHDILKPSEFANPNDIYTKDVPGFENENQDKRLGRDILCFLAGFFLCYVIVLISVI